MNNYSHHVVFNPISGYALSPYILKKALSQVTEDLDGEMWTFILCLTGMAMYQAAGETGKKVQTCLRRFDTF